MASQISGDGQPCHLLQLPPEIRDQIYADVLLDFPCPTLEELLHRAAYEVNSIVPRLDEEDLDETYYEREQESNSAPAFRRDALAMLQGTHEIDTSILLANHKTFAEAKDVILRRGRLVKVVSSNIDMSRRLCASQLCLISPKYSSLCVLTHSCKLLRRKKQGLLDVPL